MQAQSTLLALGTTALLLLTAGCGHATRTASPQPAAPGKVGLTAGTMPVRAQKVLVAERGAIGMVTRGGCVASVGTQSDGTGDTDEMRIRCPRPERLATWFSSVDRILESVPVEVVPEDEDEDSIVLPVAELVTSSGSVLKLTRKADTEKLIAEVRALSAELGAGEEPKPGPASAGGWQMIRLSGPAHVFLAGAPALGVLDARVSTTGQYLCEFNTSTRDGSLRATKSGWISAENAKHAIDEVLQPFEATAPGERAAVTYAAAVTNGGERRANVASTAQVFERFGTLQDALGDACLPELEAPAPVGP